MTVGFAFAEENRRDREAARNAPDPTYVAVYSRKDLLAHRNCVYALFDPRQPKKVMYVGKTVGHVLNRYDQHLSEAEGGGWGYGKTPCPRHKWITNLGEAGIVPSVAVLEVVPKGRRLEVAEQVWIRFYKHRGQAELNRAVVMAKSFGIETASPESEPNND